MLGKRGNLALLLIFVLLQCFAPLLHAHAGGVHRATGVHLYVDAGISSGGDLAEIKSAAQESAAVGVASELKRDRLVDVLDCVAPPTQNRPVVVSKFVALVPFLPEASPFVGFRPEPPPSHAPPTQA